MSLIFNLQERHIISADNGDDGETNHDTTAPMKSIPWVKFR